MAFSRRGSLTLSHTYTLSLSLLSHTHTLSSLSLSLTHALISLTLFLPTQEGAAERVGGTMGWHSAEARAQLMPSHGRFAA